MAGTANITSLDAVTAFRAHLIVYLGKARPLLEELAGEIIRTRQWLENDKRLYWEQQFRIRTRKLEEARAELFNARLSKLQEATALQAMAVQRAERAVRDCESKLNAIRKWMRNLEPATAPLVKQAEQLQTYLATDMTQAVAYMDNIIRALENYADVAPQTNKEPSA
ncbi:MAG TPA: hypothetical protein VMJ12_13220 [Candidatus Acidoferrales bacterium]|nr:hypothetical protein [Candidatus Acidoferrales bacterium]